MIATVDIMVYRRGQKFSSEKRNRLVDRFLELESVPWTAALIAKKEVLLVSMNNQYFVYR